MVEVSDRFIVLLLIVAISISALGVIVGLNKNLELQEGRISWLSGLSGAATSTAIGEANLTISATTSLSNQRTIIPFGSGYVNASCDFCEMDSNGVNTAFYSNGSNVSGGIQCCVGFNVSQTLGFLLENTGNVNLSVGYTCSGNCTFGLFIGGTRSPGMSGIQIKATSNSVAAQSGEVGVLDTAASCVGGGGLPFNASYGGMAWNITNSTAWGANNNVSGRAGAGVGEATYVTLSELGHWLCGNQTIFPLSSFNANDAAVVDINITIPATAPATGVQSSFRLTFNGTSGS